MSSPEQDNQLPPSFLERTKNIIVDFFGLRQTQHGINFGVLFASVLGILIVLNIAASNRIWQYDTTSKKLFTLSDQSKQVLDRLGGKPLKGKVFLPSASNPSPGVDRQSIEDTLQQFQRNYGSFEYEDFDLDANPVLANQYKIDRYGVLILEYEEKTETITTIDEKTITNTLIKLTSTKTTTVCFLKGHGEYSVEDKYQPVQQALLDAQYKVESIILIGQEAVPSTCSILVIPSSKKGLMESEVKAITTYLNNKGKALFLLNALDHSSYGKLLAEWGITVGDDIVLDVRNAFQGNPYYLVLATEGKHAITENLSMAPILFQARSVDQATEPPAGLTPQWLLKTSGDSWAEKDLTADKKPEFDQGQDTKGPISLAALVHGVKGGETTSPGTEKENKQETRIVAIGDADFITAEPFQALLGNKDIFLNSINWLAQEEDLIAITPKDSQSDPIILSGTQQQSIMYATILGMPLVIIILGIGIWVRRRKG